MSDVIYVNVIQIVFGALVGGLQGLVGRLKEGRKWENLFKFFTFLFFGEVHFFFEEVFFEGQIFSKWSFDN